MGLNIFPSLETFAKGAFATTAGISTVGVGLLYYGQNYLIYPSSFPPGSRMEVPLPTQFGLEYEDLVLTTSDDVKLRCYLMTQKRPEKDFPGAEHFATDEEFAASRPTVIMFHGNGGNHGHRIPLAKVFYVRMGCNVLMMSYRGYGLSEGSPSEKGLQIDAQTALDWVKSSKRLSDTPVYLYGQSIGGAVAIDLASRNPDKIHALMLENTFTSLPNLVPHALPMLGPFAFLCHQKWDSLSKIPVIPSNMPVLMLSGLLDEVVPKEHMRVLWEAVAKERGGVVQAVPTAEDVDGVEMTRGGTKFLEFPKGAHNDTCVQRGYWDAVTEFIAATLE